jgi:hypothetical protein
VTLLVDLIDLPEAVHRGDFVLRLAEGVARPAETLGSYVVTDSLARSFDSALSLVGSALDARTSKGAYLDGSFGSGKSHFMAVLDLLLAGNPEARAIPELATVIAKHDRWLTGKRFLLVPYHLIGSDSLESAVLGGYVKHVRALHPEAGYPAVYTRQPILDNAVNLRRQMGDDAFFGALDQAPGALDAEWGDLAGGWDAGSFDRAIAAGPEDAEQTRLASALVGSLLSGYAEAARAGGGYVNLDDGLAAISVHARTLGYDAVVLFLDELILWLASRISDVNFVSAEAAKVAKLVESANAARPAPIVSFIARQRDLRELVGEGVSGAHSTALSDVLRYWEGRFETIKLIDRDLAAIAARRLLHPRSAAAKEAIDVEFARTTQVRREVWDTLLTSQADEAMFRQTYPFSPAFMKTLIDVSGALQRERTALKVLALLLSERRDTLELGSLVPVGDLWDVIADGDDPFTEEMRANFEMAKRLYRTKLRPQLLSDHSLDDDATAALPNRHPFRTDDRLVKTLLLSALVPGTEALRGLTSRRLAALNHGTIASPIAGQEPSVVLAKIKALQSHVGEIHVGDDPANPTITLELADVDTESVMDKVRYADNDGARLITMRSLLVGLLGLTYSDKLVVHDDHKWRGFTRPVELHFGNIADRDTVRDDTLTTNADGWRIVIDVPFDAEHRTAQDHLSRLERLAADGRAARVAVWVPAQLTKGAEKQLGDLVVLDFALTGTRFDQASSHLPADQREIARQQMENRRSQLQERMERILLGAYGVAEPEPGTITDLDLADRFVSMDPSLRLRPPVAATLSTALADLVGQCLLHQYPAAPELTRSVSDRELTTVLDAVREATANPDQRWHVADHAMRRVLREVANPLRVGTMHEAPFVLERYWVDIFDRRLTATPEPTVVEMRGWIDDPQPRGLPPKAANLIIAAFAVRTDRQAVLHGAPVPISIDLHPDAVLRVVELVDGATWADAVQRAAAVFGLTASPLRSAASVGSLAAQIRAASAALDGDARALCRALEDRWAAAGLPDPGPGAGPDRLGTARRSVALVDAVRLARTDNDVLSGLATADLAPSAEAVARSLRTAHSVADAVAGAPWTLLAGAISMGGAEASGITGALRQTFAADQFSVELEGRLTEIARAATELLTRAASRPDRTPDVTLPPGPPPAPIDPGAGPLDRAPAPNQVIAPEGASDGSAHQRVTSEADLDTLLSALLEALTAAAGGSLDVSWRIDRAAGDGPT